MSVEYTTPRELGDKLYGCADAIRDVIDEARYKNFILPLVFYKSVDDTYSDLLAEAKEKYGGDEDLAGKELETHPELNGISVPKDYRWDYGNDDDREGFVDQTDNIATFLDEAFEALERQNEERLKGVVRVTYADEESLTGEAGDQKLRNLIQEVDQFNLSTQQVDKDFLGDAYMYMIGEFAKDEGKSGGQFFTPSDVIDLMVGLLEPYEKGLTVHDPTAGSGGFPVHAARDYRENGGDPGTWEITGQEINADIAAIAREYAFVNGIEADIRLGDTLSDPQFPQYHTASNGVDRLFSNFPFSANWDKEDISKLPERFEGAGKLPRANRADYAFILHIKDALSDQGRAGVIVPQGVLFRKHEGVFRELLLEEDLIEGIITLPSNEFQNVNLPAAILLLNKDKPEERENKILFINGDVEEFYEEKSDYVDLTKKGRRRITDIFHNWEIEQGLSQEATLEEVRENDTYLNVSLYVDTTESMEEIDLQKVHENHKSVRNEIETLEIRLDSYLEEMYNV